MISLNNVLQSSYLKMKYFFLSLPQVLKDKYPNFEVGLKCIIMVF